MANASATQQHQSVVVAYSLTGVWRRCIRYKTRPVSKDAGFLFFKALINHGQDDENTTNDMALVAISCLAGRTSIVRIQPKSPLDAGFLFAAIHGAPPEGPTLRVVKNRS